MREEMFQERSKEHGEHVVFNTHGGASGLDREKCLACTEVCLLRMATAGQGVGSQDMHRRHGCHTVSAACGTGAV